MGKSQRPRLRELRDLYVLVGECRELGADPLAWRQHMAQGLLQLLHANVAVYNEWEQTAALGENDWLQPRLLVDAGWPCESDHAVCLQFMCNREVDMAGFWATPQYFRLAPSAEHRRRFINDRAWHRGRFFNEVFRACHLDDTLLLTHQNGREWQFLCLHKSLGQPGFERRQQRLLRLFLLEYGRLIGKELATAGGLSVADLSPREREVLVALMRGNSEKQVALHLGISRHTAHDYVKHLHARFGVTSRGELLARCRALWPALKAMGPLAEGKLHRGLAQ